MDTLTTADTLTALGRGVLALVESGGLMLASVALAAVIAAAFCLGRLVERAVADLRRTGMPPTE